MYLYTNPKFTNSTKRNSFWGIVPVVCRTNGIFEPAQNCRPISFPLPYFCYDPFTVWFSEMHNSKLNFLTTCNNNNHTGDSVSPNFYRRSIVTVSFHTGKTWILTVCISLDDSFIMLMFNSIFFYIIAYIVNSCCKYSKDELRRENGQQRQH